MTVFAGGRVVTDKGLFELGWVEIDGELIVDRGIGDPQSQSTTTCEAERLSRDSLTNIATVVVATASSRRTRLRHIARRSFT